MLAVLRAKFSQNEHARLALLWTHQLELVEASPFDRLYGIGLGIETPEDRALIVDRRNWRGTNQLGHLLQMVRGEIALDFPLEAEVCPTIAVRREEEAEAGEPAE
jgi:ribA/ribD-fused uncharacterized protein